MYKVIAVGLLVYIGMGLYLYLKQRSFLYFPTKHIEHNHKTFQIENDGESINVVVVNPNKNKALLYFGGNGEPVASGASIFEAELLDYTTYLVEYRGYGDSTGNPTQDGIVSDALKIYDKIKENHKSISLFGRSLGTGVAMQVAKQREIEKIALITPFDKITTLAQDRYPIYPMSLLLKDKYDSLSIAPMLKIDTLILIAADDKLVPPKYAYNLASAFEKSYITTVEIDDCNHANIAETQRYIEVLGDFFGVAKHRGQLNER